MSTLPPQEIEAKFLVTDLAALTPLKTGPELAPGYDLAAPWTVEHVDTYLDTADFRLLRHGYGLRIRTVEGQRIAGLKSLRIADTGDIYRRLEIEETLADDATTDPINGWPEPIIQAILPLLAHERTLRPLCVLRQTRVKREVVTASTPATPIGELSLDTVRVAGAPNGPVLACYEMLEIELKPGADEQELESVVQTLREQVHAAPSPQSKLEEALSVVMRRPDAVRERWQGMSVNMHMAEACRLIWREQLTVMLLNEAGVRFSDDPEYVHDMRVATRRARAAAKLYGGYFRTKAIRRHLRGLRETAHLLGAVRDLDVAIAKLQQFMRRSARTKDAHATPNPAGLAQLLETWRARRQTAHAALITWFNSDRYNRFVTDFFDFCHSEGKGTIDYTPKAGAAPTPYQVRHVAPSMIMNRFEGVRSFETLFESGQEVPVTILHLLRIECKYLRYNLEFAASLLGPQSERLVSDLRKLQEHLGQINDAAVTKAMLAEAFADGVDPGIDAYKQSQEKVIRKLRSSIVPDLVHFVSKSNRRRLALAVAAI